MIGLWLYPICALYDILGLAAINDTPNWLCITFAAVWALGGLVFVGEYGMRLSLNGECGGEAYMGLCGSLFNGDSNLLSGRLFAPLEHCCNCCVKDNGAWKEWEFQEISTWICTLKAQSWCIHETMRKVVK